VGYSKAVVNEYRDILYVLDQGHGLQAGCPTSRF
jgi:hypothetical protein